jgi:hypothetical protein
MILLLIPPRSGVDVWDKGSLCQCPTTHAGSVFQNLRILFVLTNIFRVQQIRFHHTRAITKPTIATVAHEDASDDMYRDGIGTLRLLKARC